MPSQFGLTKEKQKSQPQFGKRTQTKSTNRTNLYTLGESSSKVSKQGDRLKSEQRRSSMKENPYSKDLHTVSQQDYLQLKMLYENKLK